ncbi:hypothetical protein HBH56_232080 [Parastagonospora nodorum]|uniref:Retroviral polymerase SH3-like domain-containing protein n=1 Tax=Phaeosphaeria nodorum (strain SN15 / ATCC MYA-4574 / FGSC 10173) TaxID=321614 RepID=A0A7U2NRC8_PHANO|nr:hypothetical protein HBH56_232080 [Parastagonospora nodorum]QRD07755.1 hypothetical protein JI435_161930 [Parastagonospora nodorum SN15]KAH3921471.1 hypothetical protein HBH54_241000 [Parastagonospora nodorum]KAH3956972.1 hypothetical protein HBH51_231800 [Parastagonospora nodorum]KAH4045088.1 hypothetical protein HBH49_204670 [Parastagonospora nodorum]
MVSQRPATASRLHACAPWSPLPHTCHSRCGRSPLAATYAAELLNHYSTTAVPDDKTPQPLLLEHTAAANPVPNFSTFRKFGDPGWIYIPRERRVRGEKFAPRATKMYFVGREGPRIYMMWDPTAKKVARSSSVTFASCDDLLDASIERATALLGHYESYLYRRQHRRRGRPTRMRGRMRGRTISSCRNRASAIILTASQQHHYR